MKTRISLLIFIIIPLFGFSQSRVIDNKGTLKTIDESKWTLSGSDIYLKQNGNVGIGTTAPKAKLHVKGSTLFETTVISDKASGGLIGTADATVDMYTSINLNQTTVGQTLSLPSPTDLTAGRMLKVNNIGTTSVTIATITIDPQQTTEFVWNGSAWAVSTAIPQVISGAKTFSAAPSAPSLNLSGSDNQLQFNAGTATGTFTWQPTGVKTITFPNVTGTVALLSDITAASFSLNNLTATSQALGIGTAGTEPAWNSLSATHTLNIPLASTASVTAGLLSNTDWTSFNTKVSSVTAGSTKITIGGTATAPTVDVDPSKLGTVTLATTTTGTDISVTGSPANLGGTLTLNVPDASATARGVITTGMQTIAGNKIFSGSTTVFGSGEGGTPTTTFIRGPQAGGTGTPGADLYIQASNGTGAGKSGNIIFQTGAAGTVSVPTVSTIVNQTFPNSTTQTLSYTVPNGGTNQVLMVEVNLPYAGISVSSITYNGRALSSLSHVTSSSSKVEIWYLVAPDAGSSKDIVVNLSGWGIVKITAMTWANVNQSTPFGTPDIAENVTNTVASLSPASSLGQVVMDFLTTTSSSITPTAGQTSLDSYNSGPAFYNTSGYITATTGTTAIGYSLGVSSNYGYMAFAINSSTSGGGNALSDALIINNSGNTVIAKGKSLALTDGGVNTVSLAAPSSVPTAYVLKLPAGQGGGGQTLLNDGNGGLSWGIPAYTLLAATGSTLGGVKVGSGLSVDGTGLISTTNSGTVSSVGLSLPTEMTVTNSPITSSGTLTASWANQTANTFFAAPSLGGAPTFRAIAAADIPSIDLASKVSGILPVANGGTGSSTQNWVDLSYPQSIAGAKTWTGLGTFSSGLTASGAGVSINDNSNFATTINTGTSTGAVNIANGTSGNNVIVIGNNVLGTSLTQRVGTGNYSLDGVGASTYTIGASTTTGTITIGGSAQTGVLTLGSSSASQTLNVGTGTGASTVNIANGVAGNTVSIANGANTTPQTINIGAGAGTANKTINIGSGTNTAGVTAVTIGTNTSLANTTTIKGGNNATAISLIPQTAGGIVIGASAGNGAITLGNSTAAQTVNVGTGAGASTVNIANGTAGNTVSIANGANTAPQFINIGAGASAANNTINIGSGVNTGGGVTAVNIGTNTNFQNTTTIKGGNNAIAISLIPQTNGGIVIGASAGLGEITLGNSTAAQTVNVGTGTGGTVNVGNTTSAINLNGATTVSTGVLAVGSASKVGSIALHDNATGSNAVVVKGPSTTMGSSYNLILPSAQGGTNTILNNDGSGNLSWVANSGGTVTSVGLSLPGEMTVTNSLITSSGALTASWANQSANTFFAGPSTGLASPTFRAIVAADIPTLNQNTTGTAANVTGTVAAGNGGTGLSSIAANNLMYGAGTSAVSLLAPHTTTGAILMSTASGAPSWSLLNGLPTTAGVLNVINGGTGSSTKNWVDLSSDQSIGGAKTWTGVGTFSSLATFNAGLNASGAAVSINDNSNNSTSINTGTSTGAVNIASGTVGGNAIKIGNTNGATSLTQRVGTGNYSLDGVGASTYTIGASTVGGTITIGGTAQTGALTLGSSSVAQTVNVGTGAGVSTVNIANGTAGNIVSIANGANTAAQIINIGAGAGTADKTINIGSGTNTGGVTAVTIGTNTNFQNTTTIEGGTGIGAISLTPQTTGSIIIGASNGTGDITLGNSTAAQTVNVLNGVSADNQIVNILSGAGINGVGAINLGDNPRVTTIDIGNTAPAAARTITIAGGNAAVVDQINIGTGSASVAGGKTINIGTTAPTGSGTNIITIGAPSTVARNGVRFGTSRVVKNYPLSPTIGGNVTLSAAQVLDAGIYVISGSATVTFPTAATLVAAMPSPQIGDVITFAIVPNGNFTPTIAVGTGGTIGSQTTGVARVTRYLSIRLTNVSAGTEAYTIY